MKKYYLLVTMTLCLAAILMACSKTTPVTEDTATVNTMEEESNPQEGALWENGGKPIKEYTWEEFLVLSGEQQEAFYEAFESAEAFDRWLNRVNPDETVPAETLVIEKPWENGGKAVEEYTWAEFLALSGEQQEAFYEAFESAEAFDAWRNRVNPEDSEQVEEKDPEGNPWENGGKAVEEYTWAEFQQLSAEQQEAFFEAFESAEAFDAWRNRVNPEDREQVEEKDPEDNPWENGGKAVEEYTWAEFQQLSAEQQEAFFEAFDSVEAFETWMEKAKP